LADCFYASSSSKGVRRGIDCRAVRPKRALIRPADVPQRLKPHRFCGVCGTAKGMPLMKQGFSAACEAMPFRNEGLNQRLPNVVSQKFATSISSDVVLSSHGGQVRNTEILRFAQDEGEDNFRMTAGTIQNDGVDNHAGYFRDTIQSGAGIFRSSYCFYDTARRGVDTPKIVWLNAACFQGDECSRFACGA
jgi:hypothetical protein